MRKKGGSRSGRYRRKGLLDLAEGAALGLVVGLFSSIGSLLFLAVDALVLLLDQDRSAPTGRVVRRYAHDDLADVGIALGGVAQVGGLYDVWSTAWSATEELPLLSATPIPYRHSLPFRNQPPRPARRFK